MSLTIVALIFLYSNDKLNKIKLKNDLKQLLIDKRDQNVLFKSDFDESENKIENNLKEATTNNSDFSENTKDENIITTFEDRRNTDTDSEKLDAADTSTDTKQQKLNPNFKFIWGNRGERDAVVEYQDICLDRNGLFFPTDDNNSQLPRANIAGSADFLDQWFTPASRELKAEVEMEYRDYPLFLLGGVWPYHLSHFFVNNFTPLVNLFNNYFESKNWKGEKKDLYLVKDFIYFDLESLKLTNVYKSTPNIEHNKVVCYSKVIVGLNSTCDCCGCLKDYEDKSVHRQTKDLVLENHLTAEEFQIAMERSNGDPKDRKMHLVVVQRGSNRQILNLPEVEKYLTDNLISYEVAILENLSFTQQLRLFSLNATAILAVHGNALGNSFWMPPESQVIELHSYNQGSAWFEHILSDQNKVDGHRLKYSLIACNNLNCSDRGITSFNAGVSLEIEKLDVILFPAYSQLHAKALIKKLTALILITEVNNCGTKNFSDHLLELMLYQDSEISEVTEFQNITKNRDAFDKNSEVLSSSEVSGNQTQNFENSVENLNDYNEEDIELLNQLCDYENGFELLVERIKQSLYSSKESVMFLKKRAVIEEDYSKQMSKLVASTSPNNQLGRDGTFQTQFENFLKIHAKIAEVRLKLSHTITGIAEDLNTIQKNGEKSRKQLKDAVLKYQKSVTESETTLEKAKLKYELSSEEWEKSILLKETFEMSGENPSTGSNFKLPKSVSGLNLFKQSSGKNNTNILKLQRNEEETRIKAANANESYKMQIAKANAIRTEFFKKQLPQFISSLKDTCDEIDVGLQSTLLKYAHEMEAAMMKEALAMSPLERDEVVGSDNLAELGLIKCLAKIKNREDFTNFNLMQLEQNKLHNKPQYNKQNFDYVEFKLSNSTLQLQRQKIKQSQEKLLQEKQQQEKAISPIMPVNTEKSAKSSNNSNKFYFGIDLTEQLTRDNTEVPYVLESCVRFIESENNIRLKSNGLYRLSGNNRNIKKLKALFESGIIIITLINKDLKTLFLGEKINLSECSVNVNDIAGLLKLYFRELPEPLFTKDLYNGFIEASKHDDIRHSLISIHELINLLPDANYATLRYLMNHLWNVQENQVENKMNISNLSIVFGPTLLDFPSSGGEGDLNSMSKVVEIVLSNFSVIFDV
ncbi:hypothetical protein HDU92_005156 [Lobulomyces angularis]|nr:hypothetical protein HDU92_005156 [Lobulomyces angularis]